MLQRGAYHSGSRIPGPSIVQVGNVDQLRVDNVVTSRVECMRDGTRIIRIEKCVIEIGPASVVVLAVSRYRENPEQGNLSTVMSRRSSAVLLTVKTPSGDFRWLVARGLQSTR